MKKPKEPITCSNCGKPFDDKDAAQNAHIHMPVTEGKYKGMVFDAYYCVECMDAFIEVLCGTAAKDPVTGEDNPGLATWEEHNV
ncbi:MAG: hypothetical protein J6S14_15200 [Clostridia bacterium]|nr:hypothetical protein [Clostridia bacterium]